MLSNYHFNLRMFWNVVAAITLLVVAQAHAGDIQINLLGDGTPPSSPVTEYLTVGTYVVTPTDNHYISLNVWGDVVGCNINNENCIEGWIYKYAVELNGIINLNYHMSDIFGTPEQAFGAAEVQEFTIATDDYVDFYIDDLPYSDNIGGISIVISPKDTDGDGNADVDDNCIDAVNPDQDDTDGDDCGNLCDADYTQDGFVGFADFGQLSVNYGSTGHPLQQHVEPIDPGRVVGFADFGYLSSVYGKPNSVGPSGTTAGTTACP